MGPLGEQLLVSRIGKLSPSDSKLKVSIVRAFALANVTSPSIDFVIEILLRIAK